MIATKMRLISGIVFGLSLFAAGCGGGVTSLENCLQGCEAQRRCGVITDSVAQNCKTDCNSRSGSLNDQDRTTDQNCSNGPKFRGEQLSCLSQECNKIQTCLALVDTTCVTK